MSKERMVMSKMRAKMVVCAVNSFNDDMEELVFQAVGKTGAYEDDGLDENNTYSTYTPSAELKMVVSNPALVGQFSEGQAFYVDFTEVNKAPD